MVVDRYHLVVIESPTQARHASSYGLDSWRKHREDRGAAIMGAERGLAEGRDDQRPRSTEPASSLSVGQAAGQRRGGMSGGGRAGVGGMH